MFQRLLSLFDRTVTEPLQPLMTFAVSSPAQTSPEPFFNPIGVDHMQATVDKYQEIILADLSRKTGSDAGAIGPIITILIQILPQLIAMLMSGCGPTPVPVPPAKAKAKANSPNRIDKFVLRVKLAEQVPGFDAETVAMRNDLFDSIIVAGKQVTEEDVTPIA